MKCFYLVKDPVTKMKKQTTYWGNIWLLANCMSDKFSRKHKEYIKDSPNSIEKTQIIRKWIKNVNKYFTKENIQVANKHLKSSTLLGIKETEITTTIRYHYIIIKKD